MASQSGTPERSLKGDRTNSKIKKSREPKVATPSDSESAEDEILGLIESDADVPELVVRTGHSHLRTPNMQTEKNRLLSDLCEKKQIVCTIC